MNGAQALMRTLLDSGVDVCFANPGTSEMHFVAALDSVPRMRGVLTLFEGVATGAADGYARIAGRPAVALLHLGPGLGNGLANLHNARKAHTPIVVVIGDHATDHQRYDAPLQSDIEPVAGSVSGWVRRVNHVRTIGHDTALAVAHAMAAPGQISTLIVPADVSWSEGGSVVRPMPPRPLPAVDEQAVKAAAEALATGAPATLLLGGAALSEHGLRLAQRIAAATGASLLGETFPVRARRGVGLPVAPRLAYFAEAATAQLDGTAHLILAGARAPVSFFAYPGREGDLVPPACHVHTLAAVEDDVVQTLEALADRVGAAASAPADGRTQAELPAPSGPIDLRSFAAAVASALPAEAIVVDETNTSGAALPAATANAAPHDVLALTGGAIGHGMPMALGAALAAPDRPVLSLQADGSAMYTIQALWSQAREGANVTTVLLNNRSYAILRMELARTGAGATPPAERANAMLDLSRPDLDFTALARGMGVPAVRVTTADDLHTQLLQANAEPGPHLIEAMLA